MLDAAFPHKSDVGGVHLNITSPTALESALDAIDRLAPDRPLRYLIEEMLPSGLELIIGGTRNPSFGPTILVGLGGVVAEVLHDVSLRLAPLTLLMPPRCSTNWQDAPCSMAIAARQAQIGPISSRFC